MCVQSLPAADGMTGHFLSLAVGWPFLLPSLSLSYDAERGRRELVGSILNINRYVSLLESSINAIFTMYTGSKCLDNLSCICWMKHTHLLVLYPLLPQWSLVATWDLLSHLLNTDKL